jgi:hypothetical protein
MINISTIYIYIYIYIYIIMPCMSVSSMFFVAESTYTSFTSTLASSRSERRVPEKVARAPFSSPHMLGPSIFDTLGHRATLILLKHTTKCDSSALSKNKKAIAVPRA